MESLDFKIATLNTGLVRFELFNIDVYHPIPVPKPRRIGLVNMLKNAEHDIICLQEVYSRSQQHWLRRQLENSKWHVINSTDHSWPFIKNWGLVTLIDRQRFKLINREDFSLAPVDWTEVIIGAKGVLAVQIEDRHNPDRPLWIVNLHTTYGGLGNAFDAPPAEALRSGQLRKVGNQFSHKTALILGDFNCPSSDASQAYRVLCEQYQCTDLIAPYQNPTAFKTWDPDNPLHKNIFNPEDKINDTHHARIDHIFGTSNFLESYTTAQAKMIWNQPIIPADFPNLGDYCTLSDHYGLELCVSAKRDVKKTRTK